jgi:hypothetical protein
MHASRKSKSKKYDSHQLKILLNCPVITYLCKNKDLL